MTYYIVVPHELVEAENNIYNERYELGEESFGTFYPSQGYFLFEDLVDKMPEVLDEIEIRTDQDEAISPEEFLEILEELTVLV